MGEMLLLFFPGCMGIRHAQEHIDKAVHLLPVQGAVFGVDAMNELKDYSSKPEEIWVSMHVDSDKKVQHLVYVLYLGLCTMEIKLVLKHFLLLSDPRSKLAKLLDDALDLVRHSFNFVSKI